MILPEIFVSFKRYLQLFFGNDFKFLELRSNIPLLVVFSKTLSTNNTNLDEFDDGIRGEEGPPPGPPGSITQTDISIIFYQNTSQ